MQTDRVRISTRRSGPMNFRRMAIAMGIGLAISASCTYLLSRRISAQRDERPADLKYVAPSRPLRAGELLKSDATELVSWPAATPIPDAFARPETVIGRYVLYPVAKGQPLTEELLTANGAGMGLAGKIPEGMRAIALRTDEVVGVAGFLLPDSHVDVLATLHTSTMPEPTTYTVLQNAQVLAAGHQIEPDPEGKPAAATVVTLLLSPADAEKAVLASQQGTIHFVLRSGSDTETPQPPSLDVAQLIGRPTLSPSLKTETVVARAPRAAPPLPTPVLTPHPMPSELTVETIAGDKESKDTFRVTQR